MNNVSIYQEKKKNGLAVYSKKAFTGVAAGTAAVLAAATSSFAGITELFAGVDISGAETAVQTLMIAMVVVGVMFFGYKLLKRIGVAA